MFFEDDEEKAAYLREIQKESDRNYEDKHALMKHQDPEETDPEKRVSYLNHGPYVIDASVCIKGSEELGYESSPGPHVGGVPEETEPEKLSLSLST